MDQQQSVDAALVERLRIIEDQPLQDRAAAYLALHDEFRGLLEGGDEPRQEG